MNDSKYRELKYLPMVSGFFVAVLLISNIASTKIVGFGPLTFDGGTLLFPLSYIFGDVLTEVYGYKRSRKVIWTGFISALVMSLTFATVGALPAAGDWPFQEAFSSILGQVPRIVIASLIAYFAGEFSNSYILAKMKVRSGGKRLWQRTIGSTIVGQIVDTGLFVLIAFAGVLPWSLVWTLIWSNYVFKVGIEILFTPATYKVVGFLKKHDNEDYFDQDTKFNPFSLDE